LSEQYSKAVFDMNYPIIKKVNNNIPITENRMVKDRTRYYAGVFTNGENQYLISSEWFDRSLEGFIQWLKRKLNKIKPLNYFF
jgi:hypothetical protein